MAQKTVLRGEVGTRALRVRLVPREEVLTGGRRAHMCGESVPISNTALQVCKYGPGFRYLQKKTDIQTKDNQMKDGRRFALP
jgi:hypothetical protein